MRGFKDFPLSQIDVSSDLYPITNSDSNKGLWYSDDEKMSIAQAQSDVENSEKEDMDDNEDYETLTVSEAPNNDNRYDDQIDIYKELENMKKFKDAKLDAHFPNEIDLKTFQHGFVSESIVVLISHLERARGIHKKINHMHDYTRIFKFENFDHTRERVFKESEDIEGAM
ncbi:hypothetical protein PV325_013500, partial [Microctonus aethiopoides]